MRGDMKPDVCVIGLGYIGLPTAAVIARAGCPVHGVDVAQGVVRYKKNEGDQWISYKPTAAEAERAQAYFGQ